MTQGEKLRALRKRAGISQEDLGARVGYASKTAITFIETGRTTIPTARLQTFADVLGCSPEDLLPDDDAAPTSPAAKFVGPFPEERNPFEASVIRAFRQVSDDGKLTILMTALRVLQEEGKMPPEEDKP